MDVSIQIPLSIPETISSSAPLLSTHEPVPIVTMEMNGSTIIMKVGDKRKLMLPGNATTGYAWRIVRREGNSIHMDKKWRYKPEFPFLMGSGGYFQQELIAKELGITDLYLMYDPVAEPQLGYSYFLQVDVQP